MTRIYTVLAVLFSVPSWATYNCSQMYDRACESHHDVEAMTSQFVSAETTRRIQQNIQTAIEPTLRRAMTSNAEYYRLMVQTFSEELPDRCRRETVPSNWCIQRFLPALSHMIVFADKNNRSGSLRTLMRLLDHPTTGEIYARARREIQSGVNATERLQRTRRMLNSLKSRFVARLREMLPESPRREAILRRINEIQVGDGSNFEVCLRPRTNYFLPNAFYDNTENKVYVCPSQRINTVGEYTLASTVAHEMAHAAFFTAAAQVNSSGTREQMNSRNIFSEQIQCLRNVPNAQPTIAPYADPAYLSGNQSINAQTYSIEITTNDQMSETFADWMASDIASSYLRETYPEHSETTRRNAYLGTASLLCFGSEVDDEFWEIHRTGRRRVQTMINTPEIHRQLNCAGPAPTQARSCQNPSRSSTGNARQRNNQ